jgi:hypothetical protein
MLACLARTSGPKLAAMADEHMRRFSDARATRCREAIGLDVSGA